MRHSRSRRNSVRSCPVRSGAQSGGIVGLLCLLSILPIDGVLLKWLHRGIGALIGKGAYVMPFALIGIAVLLFARPKGPVRLRGTCIALMPLLIGSIIHAFSCANEYDLSMSTLSGLLSTGMEGSSGGLLGGGLYILLEWALSSIGALLILLVLFIVSLLVACRITPQALYDMVRPPEYEYEDEEERERYEAPLQLPNIHEAAAAHAQRREERRAHRKSDFDIPIDTDPPGEDKPGEELIDPRKRKGKAIAPDEYLRSLRDNVKKKAGSIMDLVENKQTEEESAHVSEPEPEHEAAPAPASKSKKDREHLGDRAGSHEYRHRREPESAHAGLRLPADRSADTGQARLCRGRRSRAARKLSVPARYARLVQHRGADHRHRARPVGHPVRADHPARHQDLAHHRPVGRHCAVARRGERAYRAYPG